MSCRCHRPCAEATADDQVEGVRRVVAVEHDLAAIEAAPTSDREELPDVLRRETNEKWPLHVKEVSVTSLTFAMSAA